MDTQNRLDVSQTFNWIMLRCITYPNFQILNHMFLFVSPLLLPRSSVCSKIKRTVDMTTTVRVKIDDFKYDTR